MARKTTITGDGVRDDSITGDDVDESTLILDTLRDADGDTKIQVEESADGDKIRFDTAGGERMIITEHGLVGIGTDDPDNTLHIFSTGHTHLKIQSEDGSYAAVKMKSGTGGSTYVWTPADTSDIRLYAGGADRVHVDNNGNVGFGTTTPASTLSVDGSISAGVTLINTGNDPGTTYSVVDTDYVILVNTRPTPQGGIDSSLTITLPLAASYPGRIIVVKDSGGYSNINNITISRAGSDTIEGVNTTLVLNNIAQFTRLISNGVSNWCEIGS
ncbi:hypothetical protein CL614_10170 [archaeon]|jgi:hypothetical protein|nr:hypothetical protein [archaeon]